MRLIPKFRCAHLRFKMPLMPSAPGARAGPCALTCALVRQSCACENFRFFDVYFPIFYQIRSKFKFIKSSVLRDQWSSVECSSAVGSFCSSVIKLQWRLQTFLLNIFFRERHGKMFWSAGPRRHGKMFWSAAIRRHGQMFWSAGSRRHGKMFWSAGIRRHGKMFLWDRR